MSESEFAAGTPVRVRQTARHGSDTVETEVVGVVESWGDRPTGSWHAHGKNGRLWLTRLTLRKADGELSVLVIDDSTTIARLEPAPSAEGG